MELRPGIKPIVDKFLERNYLFAMEWKEGWIFGRVIRRRICQYKPWPLIDAAGNAVDIPASTHQSELRFRDPRNTENDILYLDSATNSGYPWFLHGSIGIRPQYIYMYLRMPEGREIPGKFPNIDPIQPSAGNNVGYISYHESPYDTPTDFIEIVIPPLTHIAAEYYNKDPDRAHQPVLNLLFALYWFQPLNPSVHGKLISDIAARRVPAAFFTVGFGDTPLEMGSTLEREWGVRAMSLDDALRLGGGW